MRTMGLSEAEAIVSRVCGPYFETLETQHPRGLTVIHSLGIGDRKSRGMNRFAHEGMVKRVIGGHWVWSPRMQQLAKDAVNTTKDAEKASLQAVEGKADLNQVVNSVTAAELTVQTVTAVRDRVISAYQEVLRMPI